MTVAVCRVVALTMIRFAAEAMFLDVRLLGETQVEDPETRHQVAGPDLVDRTKQ